MQRLEGVVLSEEKDKAAIAIAKVYLPACKIHFGALQQLCVDKLKALYPISSNNMLIVFVIAMKAVTNDCQVEHEIKVWFIVYIESTGGHWFSAKG